MNLKEARFKKGFKQYDLFLKTGIAQCKISLFEQGYMLPREDEKLRLAEALEIEASTLEFSMRK